MKPTSRVDSSRRSVDEDLSFADLVDQTLGLLQLAWQRRVYFLRALSITVPLGFLVAFGSTAEYTAKTKILPYRSTSGPQAGLSGLAGLAGIRLSGGATDPTITAELYPEVAKTLDFRIAVAETKIRFSSLRDQITPAKYFAEVSTPSFLETIARYTIGLPRFVLSKFQSTPQLDIPGNPNQPRIASYSQAYLAAVNQLDQRLLVDINRKTGIITIQATMPDRYASADLVRAASERLMQRIIDFESRKAGEQRRFLESETQRARERFEGAQAALATFTDRNRGTLSATNQIVAQRLQAQYNLAFELYRQFSTELEQSRIRENQDAPVFAVLEQVVVPDSRSSPMRTLDLLFSVTSGIALGAVLAWWRTRQNSAIRGDRDSEVV